MAGHSDNVAPLPDFARDPASAPSVLIVIAAYYGAIAAAQLASARAVLERAGALGASLAAHPHRLFAKCEYRA